MKNIGLVDLELKYNARGNFYCLDATYELETDNEVRELKVHDIELPINPFCVELRQECCDINHFPPERTVDLGFGPLRFGYCRERVVKEKVKEVTMEDIEKKFGCKIKIVK